MSNSVNSILSNILHPPSAGASNAANTSWYLGSAKTPKVASYLTVMKAPKSNSAAAAIASHFGVNLKNPKNKAAKKQHESLLGSILGGAKDVGGNLVTDVINTAEGTPAGLLKLATTNPIDSAKAIGHDYATRYGKLFKGDFGGFAHDVTKHPFSYLLDASSLGTGSGAILGRLAPALAKGGEVGLRINRAEHALGDTAKVSRPLSANVFTRNVFEKPAYALQRTLPQKLPILGESAAAKRTVANVVEGKKAEAHRLTPALSRAVKEAQKGPHVVGQAIDELNRHFDKVGGKFQPIDPRKSFNIMDTKAVTPEVDAVVKQVKSELQKDTNGNLVAKADASPATISFLKIHNAKSALNQVWEARQNAGVLNGLKHMDLGTDSVRNYLDTHALADEKTGNLVAKAYLDKYTKDPQTTRELTQMFDKHGPSSSLEKNFNAATQGWKDLILMRPGFILNNWIGNQSMYHLKNGLAGVALQKAAKGEYNGAYEHFFSEHRTLGDVEKGQGNTRFGKMRNKFYGLQSGHEQVLKKATMSKAAMAIPAIKTEVRALTGKGMSQGKALESAMNKAFKSPEGANYRALINKAIDDTTGNYRHFSASEQKIRGIVPFYSWNRHALRTYSSIIKDQPIEAAALSQIGTQGKQDNAKLFPGTPDFMSTYVKGALGTFDTQSLNPLKGGSDTIKSIKELVSGNPGNMPALASNLNPFIGGAVQALSGVNMTTGAPVTVGGGLLGSVAQQTIGGLPEVKIAKLGFGSQDTGNRKDPHYFLTPTGQLKRKFKDSEGKVKLGPDGLPLEAADRHMINQSLENSVLNWLGVPKKNINIKTAQIVKKSIDSKIHPVTDFHARKSSTKKKTNHIVDLYKRG